MSAMDPNRVPLGLAADRTWTELRFTEIENPHILIVGGSRIGKTSLQMLIGAVAASRGNIVIIIDPKQRFARAFRHPDTGVPLPNVLVYSDPDMGQAAREWHGIMGYIGGERQQRYEADSQARTGILHDAARFPNILVIIDELGTMLDFTDEEFQERKPDNWKGTFPVRREIHTMSRAGAEARIIGCFANQTASEKEMPAGTRTRSLCGQRIFMGPVSEGPQWRMLAGEGMSTPEIPNRKGASAIMYGDRKPIQFQAGFIDWNKTPGKLYGMAAQGIPILRENGHLDEHDRLWLAGSPVPPPGKMASHVTGTHADLPERQAAGGSTADDAPSRGSAPEEASSQEPVSDDSQSPADDENDPIIVGLEDAAKKCGMSFSNFRRVREQNPIDGEIRNAEGNKPGWRHSDLKVWALRHAQHRTRRAPSETAERSA